MSEQHTHTNDGQATTAVRVPLLLVDYLKSVALYPPGNPRIASNCSATIAAARETIDTSEEERSDFRFVFQGDELVTSAGRLPCASDARLEWLRARCDMSALAGIAIRKDADEEALGVFADRFLEVIRSRPKKPVFEELWEDSMLGIVPLERRYDGQHDLNASLDDDVADWLLQGSDGSKLLIEMLRRSGRIAKRVQSIEDRLNRLASERQAAGEVHEAIEVDVLDQVLRSLPLEVLGDGPAIVKVVDQVLSQLEQSIANSALETGSFQLDKLMGKISQQFFAMTEGSPQQEAPKENIKRETGHAGDEKITDDSAQLFAELAELPAWEGTELGEEGEEQLGEIFAVYLTFLARVDDALALTRIRRLLRGLLSRDEAVFSAVAANFLTWCEAQAETGGDWTAFDRFVDLVEEAGCPELLSELGQLELGSLVQRFPRTFFTFIDGIDPRRDSHDADKLHQLLQLIDPDRIQAASQALTPGLQKGDRAEKILAVPRERTLPFVHLLLASDRERWMPHIAQFLAEMPSQLAESGLFRLMNPDEVPYEWVAIALRAIVEPAARKTLRTQTAQLLAEFLDASAYNNELVDQRLFAVQLLAKCPCTASLKALHRIGGRKRLFGMKREDPAIRDAAQFAIEEIEAELNKGASRV